MPTITFLLKDLQHLVGKKITIEEVENLAHYGKGDFEGYDKKTDEVKIDFGDTNLPYLWSVEGFARLIKGIIGVQRGIPQIKVKKADYKIIVDKSVAKIRPFIAGFVAKGHKTDDYLIKQLIQLQEKLSDNYGRKRQKVSIGLYSYNKITFPVHYKAVAPESIKFTPLDFKAELNLKEILKKHPKGIEYRNIIKDFDKYPILIDGKNEVLSFPPIINSNLTGKIEVGEDELFFEVTGTDYEHVVLATNIFAYALYERGFELYSANVEYSDRNIATPYLKSETITIKKDYIKKLFGLELKDSEIKTLLEKAQYNFSNFKVEIPPYRADIMHPYDVVEDIGIMYGYNRIEETQLIAFTAGSTLKINNFIDKIRELVVGLGYQEIMSHILTDKISLYENMNIKDFGTVEIDEFMSENYSVARSWILPNLISVFSKNKHVDYPQKIFEEGIVNVRKGEAISDFNRIAIATSHEKADYTEIKQALDYLLSSFGFKYHIEEVEHGSFIDGRVGRVIVKGKKVGYIGEINPEVLTRWGLVMPAAAMELNLTELFQLIEK